MPYYLQQVPGGYKVFSINGTPLSRKPLTLQKAIKQRIAATLTSQHLGRHLALYGRGSGSGEGYSLSDTDIQKVLGGVKLFRYPELHHMDSIEDAFDDSGRCMILYLTENMDTGHWVCMIKRENTIEYFDPYGGYKPDSERKWLSQAQLEKLGQDEPTLSRMIKAGGYKVESNPHHFQKEAPGVNTCGRHCCVRLLNANLSLPEYAKMVKDSGQSPDEFVTHLTSQVLHK